MRKGVLMFLLFFCMITPVHAESYCVMSGNDGSVSDEKDMHKTQSVASISKIMTAVIAIEHGNLDDTWKVSDAVLQAEGSSIYIKPGDQISLRSLLYGLMLRSGNDASLEIASHVSGDTDSFVALMNEKAKEIGMNDTTFHNPSGLDEEDGGNISSAYDMALLMRYAMDNPTFAEIVGSKYYDSELHNHWKNKNKLLFTYDAATGGKTGFTKKAGRTLVSSAVQDDMESIVVTLGMSDDFAFHEEHHEKLFQEHTPYMLLKEGTYHCQGMSFTIPETLSVLLKQDQSDTITVDSRIEDHTLIIDVMKNEEKQTYRFEGSADRSGIGGWFS